MVVWGGAVNNARATGGVTAIWGGGTAGATEGRVEGDSAVLANKRTLYGGKLELFEETDACMPLFASIECTLDRAVIGKNWKILTFEISLKLKIHSSFSSIYKCSYFHVSHFTKFTIRILNLRSNFWKEFRF